MPLTMTEKVTVKHHFPGATGQVWLITHLWREVHFHGCVCGPVAHGEDVHREVNGAWCTLVLHMLKTKISKTQ